MHGPYRLRQERFNLVNWMADYGYTHALTLNTDRELSAPRVESIFSTFCHKFDRRILGTRNVKRLPTELRLRAIAFPENLGTNAHLHVSADFSHAVKVLGSEARLVPTVRTEWLRATRGAGSIHLVGEPNWGWGKYCTKKFNGIYFLSADFFPH